MDQRVVYLPRAARVPRPGVSCLFQRSGSGMGSMPVVSAGAEGELRRPVPHETGVLGRGGNVHAAANLGYAATFGRRRRAQKFKEAALKRAWFKVPWGRARPEKGRRSGRLGGNSGPHHTGVVRMYCRCPYDLTLLDF